MEEAGLKRTGLGIALGSSAALFMRTLDRNLYEQEAAVLRDFCEKESMKLGATHEHDDRQVAKWQKEAMKELEKGLKKRSAPVCAGTVLGGELLGKGNERL
jgi:hypothetical protein